MREPTDKKGWGFNIINLVITLTIVLLVQQFWDTYRQTELISYSEFSNYLRDDKISEVEVLSLIHISEPTRPY